MLPMLFNSLTCVVFLAAVPALHDATPVLVVPSRALDAAGA